MPRVGRTAGVRDRRLGETVGPELPAPAPGGPQRLRPQAEELAAMAFRGDPERGGGTGRRALRRDRGPDGGRPQGGGVRAARLGLERPARSPNARPRGTSLRAGSATRRDPACGLRRAEPRPAAPVADRRLDLNQVSFEQLRSLDLSSTQCHRLLAYRERLGGFQSIEQLDGSPASRKGRATGSSTG